MTTWLFFEQARALVWLRSTLWRRRLVQDRQWGRAIVSLLALAMAGAFSWSLSFLVLEAARELSASAIAARGGPRGIFAAWLGLALLARVWIALLAIGQMASFLDPRRFLLYAVPPRLMGALNLGAQLFEPTWLFLYAPLACIGIGVSRLPGAPALWALFIGEGFVVGAVVGLLHLAASLAATFDARPLLRRGLSVVLVVAGLAALQLSLAQPGRLRGRLPAWVPADLFAGDHTRLLALTPPGWAATLSQALSDGSLLRALTPALLLFAVGAGCSLAAQQLSQRELIRPPEPNRAGASTARERGWSLPLLSGPFSALLEKESKTALRVGWLQLVLVPVGFVMLRSFAGLSFVGRMPLLVAALYAHLGVLDLATNSFGRDLGGARAWFLWPVSLRAVLAAKNAVSYAFSLAIFLALAVVARVFAHVTAAQLALGLCAHAAIFPLLATFGNVSSVLFPTPVRGARLRRVRGAGPVGARLFAMALLGLAAWAPYWLSRLLGLPLAPAYVGELCTMALAYGGLLAVCADLLESRRDRLLAALSRDE